MSALYSVKITQIQENFLRLKVFWIHPDVTLIPVTKPFYLGVLVEAWDNAVKDWWDFGPDIAIIENVRELALTSALTPEFERLKQARHEGSYKVIVQEADNFIQEIQVVGEFNMPGTVGWILWDGNNGIEESAPDDDPRFPHLEVEVEVVSPDLISFLRPNIGFSTTFWDVEHDYG